MVAASWQMERPKALTALVGTSSNTKITLRMCGYCHSHSVLRHVAATNGACHQEYKKLNVG